MKMNGQSRFFAKQVQVDLYSFMAKMICSCETTGLLAYCIAQ
jgi:hypothetical protein